MKQEIPEEPAKIICEYVKKIADYPITDELRVNPGKELLNDFFNFYDAVKPFLPKHHRPFPTTEECCNPGGDMNENWIYIGDKE